MTLLSILPKEAPPFLASKWLHLDLLIETDSMKELLEHLPKPLYLFSTLGVQPRSGNAISHERFLQVWQSYLDVLKNGQSPPDCDFRFFFTACLSAELHALRAIDIGQDREIIAPYEPIIQMQIHRFSYSSIDDKFHSMAFSEKSISWGIRLSYPQLYQYPHTRQVIEALNEERFSNAKLFNILRRWIRHHTQATPFLVGGQRVNVPMRIDKACFSWINNHAELRNRGLQVIV